MSDFRFPDPVKVDPANRPPTPTRGGRQSHEPAYIAWLESLQEGAEWEFLPPPGEDGKQATDNSVARLNTIRKIAKQLSNAEGATRRYKIDAIPMDDAKKRYRILASVQVGGSGKAAPKS